MQLCSPSLSSDPMSWCPVPFGSGKPKNQCNCATVQSARKSNRIPADNGGATGHESKRQVSSGFNRVRMAMKTWSPGSREVLPLGIITLFRRTTRATSTLYGRARSRKTCPATFDVGVTTYSTTSPSTWRRALISRVTGDTGSEVVPNFSQRATNGSDHPWVTAETRTTKNTTLTQV